MQELPGFQVAANSLFLLFSVLAFLKFVLSLQSNIVCSVKKSVQLCSVLVFSVEVEGRLLPPPGSGSSPAARAKQTKK